MGMATLVAPRTRGWSGAQAAIDEYVQEKEREHKSALGLDLRARAAANEAAMSDCEKEQANV